MHQSDVPDPRSGGTLTPHPKLGQTVSAWGELPVPLSTLVGREEAIAVTCRLARRPETRWLTLTGPGGVGKTRLALAAAAALEPDFADGIAFVALATITDPQAVLPAICHQLGFRGTDTSTVGRHLADALRDRHVLLILDNLEQVLGAAPSISDLLVRCPRLTVLVTSRILLGVSGEQRFEVRPLTLPDPSTTWTAESIGRSEAVQLFVARVQALDPTFELDHENAGDVGAICTRLDGLPLALELAASRLTVWSPSEILGQLDTCLGVLAGGPSDQPPRLRAMRDAIAWSWALLTPSEQVLLGRLAVFTGGFTREAAIAVGRGADGDALDELEALVRQSLVQHHVGRDGTSRFSVLETIHAFAREQVDWTGEWDDARDRHARYFAKLAGRVPLTWWLPTETVSDRTNIYAALEWSLDHARSHLILPLAVAVWQFLEPAHGYALLERSIRATSEVPPELTSRRVLVLAATAQFAVLRGDQERARDLLTQASSLGCLVPDDAFIALSFLARGWVGIDLGQLEDADRCARAARRIWEAGNAMGWVGEALILQGAAAHRDGRRADAEQLYVEASELVRVAGHPMAVVAAVNALAEVAIDRGDARRAAALTAEGLTHFLNHGVVDPAIVVGSGVTLARAADMTGYPGAAARLLGAVAVERARLGVAGVPADQEAVDRVFARLRSALSAEELAKAWAEGKQLSVDRWLVWARDLAAEIAGHGAGRNAASDHLLTPREMDVLQLVAAGWSNRAIADALSRSERTVENHLSHILAKLDVGSRTAAVAAAIDRGILVPRSL